MSLICTLRFKLIILILKRTERIWTKQKAWEIIVVSILIEDDLNHVSLTKGSAYSQLMQESF